MQEGGFLFVLEGGGMDEVGRRGNQGNFEVGMARIETEIRKLVKRGGEAGELAEEVLSRLERSGDLGVFREILLKPSVMNREAPDFVEWCERYVVLGSGERVKFEDHQERILRHVFNFKGGVLPYSTVVYSCPKKSGKTAVGAMVLIYFGCNVEAPSEILCCANKVGQAYDRAFSEMCGHIDMSVELGGVVKRRAGRVVEFMNGSRVTVLPKDFSGEAGSNHTLSLWDELWGYKSEGDRRFYEELTPVPTKRCSIRFITTYAGFEGESGLLEDLYYQVFEKDKETVKAGVTRPLGDDFPAYAKGDLFMYWDHERRMSWQQNEEYYASQKRDLRLTNYLRLHENRWVSSETGLFDMEEWDRCVDAGHRPPLPGKGVYLYVGVDASVKRDRSAVVSVYRDGEVLKLGPKRFWQPSGESPMDLEETMEGYLEWLMQRYTVINVKYDPYQFHRSAVTLRKKGLPMEEFPQTGGNLTEMGQNLHDLVKYGNIVFYE